jgi:hypothetical protein
MTSFFEHKNYTTHISQFHNPPTPLTLDSISVSIKGSERVKDCKVWHKGVDSDHSAIKLTFSLTSIKYKASQKLSVGEIDWHKIRDDEECNRKYNSILRELCPETIQYTEFGRYMMEAGRLTATRPKYERKGWFEDDREHMQPLVEKKAGLLHLICNPPEGSSIEEIKHAYKLAAKEVKDRTEIAKNAWMTKLGQYGQ